MNLSATAAKDLAAFKSSESRRRAFWARVHQGSGCWIYRGSKSIYGSFVVAKVSVLAHRYAKIVSEGLPPDTSLFCCHICREKRCVRPSHLYWGTAAENRADQWRDGTASRPSIAGELNHAAKLSATKAAVAYVRFHRDRVSCHQIATELGVNPAIVTSIVNNKTWVSATKNLRQLYFNKENLGPRKGSKNSFSKLTDGQALEIFALIFKGEKHTEIALKYGISNVLVTRMKTGLAWKHLAPDYILRSIKPPRKRISLDDAAKESLSRDYENGFTLTRLSKKYGVSVSAAHYIKSRFARGARSK